MQLDISPFSLLPRPSVREWSSITRRGGGGYKTGGGGQVKFNPYTQKGEGSFSQSEGGGGAEQTSFAVVLTQVLRGLNHRLLQGENKG